MSGCSINNHLVVGRITAVFGVRGWLKVHSYTERPEAILEYRPWWVETDGSLQALAVDDARCRSDGLVVHLVGVDDRTLARVWCQKDIWVPEDRLPALGLSEYYWHQLIGLQVFNEDEDARTCFGKVTSLLATGANDVLVVKGDDSSRDQRERLIPYADQYVLGVDLRNGVIEVQWDPEF